MDNQLILSIIVAAFSSTGLWTLVNNIYMKKAAKGKDIELLKEAQLATLQDRLLHLCTSYISRGWMTMNEKQSLYRLYNAYVKLGGNEFIHDMFDNDISRLEIKG